MELLISDQQFYYIVPLVIILLAVLTKQLFKFIFSTGDIIRNQEKLLESHDEILVHLEQMNKHLENLVTKSETKGLTVRFPKHYVSAVNSQIMRSIIIEKEIIKIAELLEKSKD